MALAGSDARPRDLVRLLRRLKPMPCHRHIAGVGCRSSTSSLSLGYPFAPSVAPMDFAQLLLAAAAPGPFPWVSKPSFLPDRRSADWTHAGAARDLTTYPFLRCFGSVLVCMRPGLLLISKVPPESYPSRCNGIFAMRCGKLGSSCRNFKQNAQLIRAGRCLPRQLCSQGVFCSVPSLCRFDDPDGLPYLSIDASHVRCHVSSLHGSVAVRACQSAITNQGFSAHVAD
jgi:hypothetical protein